MRFRSSLAFGVTAAAAATLAPAVAGAPAVADEGSSIIGSQICAVTGVLDAVIEDSSCAAEAGVASEFPQSQQQPNQQQPNQQQPASTTQNPADTGTAQNPNDTGTAQNPADTGTAQNPNDTGTVQNPADTGTAQNPNDTGTAQNPADTGTAQNPADTGTAQNPNDTGTAQNPDSPTTARPPATVNRPTAQEARPRESLVDTGAANRPTCAPADSADFPIDTRIHEGPATYHPGGGYRNWTIDLTNTTGDSCGNIHPVLVLVDQRHTLQARQIQLEFHDGTRWRPVPFEKTDQDENIGVFDDGFEGFTVGPGKTVTVKVRLAFTSDTQANHVVASAALVQRREDDGDWVGESNDYPFDIVADGPGTPSAKELAQTGPGTLLGLGATAGAFLLAGGALVVGSRRFRARER
ncbi:hypothetical protein ACFWZ2_25530 [Streptomyces sp. NPDC059002]|uniref:hypothetical protein n=1 Tax=Streptomyces sp. NPDC059002 TaxID=3346690 RepID=UPI0036AD1B59